MISEYRPSILREPSVWSRLQPNIQQVLTPLSRMFSDPLCLQDPACHMVSNYEPGCALGTRSLILNQETRHLREPAYDSIPDEEPTFQRDVVYQPASNEPRCLQVPARSSIPHSAPRHLRNLASCLKPNQKPKSLNISSPNQESDTKLEKQPEVLHIETERAGMTWTSRLLELANTEFDSVPIYSSLPFNPLLSPEKQFQVNLTVGKICVNAEGPSHETACDTAARKAVHILTGSTDPNSVAPINGIFGLWKLNNWFLNSYVDTRCSRWRSASEIGHELCWRKEKVQVEVFFITIFHSRKSCCYAE